MSLSSPPRVVVVLEDDRDILETLDLVLREAGFRAVLVKTVNDARLAIASERPALLLTDLTLDGEFGGDLLEELALRDDAPPALILSAMGLARSVAARFGVELVRKPFNIDALLESMERAMATQSRPRLSTADSKRS